METFASRFEERGIKKGFEKGMRQGLEEGLQRGLQQGRRLGEAEILIRQIERKFGPLPAELRGRIDAADTDTLLQWAERVLTAETLEQVFSP